jgi:hypothetical protein
MKKAQPYLRFLELTNAINQASAWTLLHPVEQKMLEFVAIAEFQERELPVKDLTSLHELGSPAMLHARVHALREKGWIELHAADDARRKHVRLSRLALRHFSKLGACVERALRKQAV